MLRCILDSGCLTQAQLYHLLDAQHSEKSRKACDKRARRLVRAGHVRKLSQLPNGQIGYKLTFSGAQELLANNEPCATYYETAFKAHCPIHWLCVNQLRILLASQRLVKKWISPAEQCHRNVCASSPCNVIYDAVIVVSDAHKRIQLGLLCEKIVRSAEEYRSILQHFRKRRRPHYLLIAMPDKDSLHWLRRELRSKQPAIAIATFRQLEKHMFSAFVYRVGVRKPCTLDAFLRDSCGQLNLPFGSNVITL